MTAMRLSSVHLYPVKGCYRVDVPRAAVERCGLAGDRRWMVVDPDGRMVSQRDLPALARVRPRPDGGGGLTLRASGRPDLVVPAPRPDPGVRVTVWRDTVAATPAGPAADDWLTAAAGRALRLVWLDDPDRRGIPPPEGAAGDRVGFADLFPVLLTNASSLDALNGWLRESDSPEGPLPMARFRPNVVVSGAAPWVEDTWLGRRIRIGRVTFRAVRLCGRCLVTTTDQETGVRGAEPLRTLAKRRVIEGRARFGLNLIPDPPYGEVAVDDPVTVPGGPEGAAG
jgi:uncharacterized protein